MNYSPPDIKVGCALSHRPLFLFISFSQNHHLYKQTKSVRQDILLRKIKINAKVLGVCFEVFFSQEGMGGLISNFKPNLLFCCALFLQEIEFQLKMHHGASRPRLLCYRIKCFYTLIHLETLHALSS